MGRGKRRCKTSVQTAQPKRARGEGRSSSTLEGRWLLLRRSCWLQRSEHVFVAARALDGALPWTSVLEAAAVAVVLHTIVSLPAFAVTGSQPILAAVAQQEPASVGRERGGGRGREHSDRERPFCTRLDGRR
eukprot:653424-Pleurochrysis_carterae.AAC.1